MTKTSKKNPKTKRRTDQKTNEMTTQRFLVVADIGPDADYSTEPRHFVEVQVNPDVDYRRSPKQRQMLEERLRWRISGLPSNDIPLLIWMLDAKDHPVRLLNGTKAVSDTLLPMVSCRQTMHTATILMHLYGEATADFEGEEWSDEQSEVENEVLDNEFGDLTDAEMWTSDLHDDQLTVIGCGWKEVEVDLPFVCTRHLTLTQIEFALDAAYHAATDLVAWEPYSDMGIQTCSEQWLINGGKQVLSLEGLRDLRLGKISRQKFQATCIMA